MRLFAELSEALRPRRRPRRAGRRRRSARVGADGRDLGDPASAMRPARASCRADAVVLATGGFAAGGIELDSYGGLREVALGLPVSGLPEGVAPLSERHFDDQPLMAARAWRSTRSCARVDAGGEPVWDNVLVAGATLAGAEPWREKSGDGIASPARTGRPAPSWRRHDPPAARADARFARPLRQVHDLRDLLPGRGGHPAVPRARSTSGRRPSASAVGDAIADASLDYCSGCGICTQVCPQGVQIAEINSQARAELAQERGVSLRDRLIARPTLAGRLGAPVAPLANWTLSIGPFAAAAREGAAASTARRRCRGSPGGPSRAGPAPAQAARAARIARWSSSTAAGPTTTSPASAR